LSLIVCLSWYIFALQMVNNNTVNKISIFTNLEFNEEKPIVTTLLETNCTKDLRVAMLRGNRIAENRWETPVLMEIVEGDVSVGVKGEILPLTKGDLVYINAMEPYDILAYKNSIIRLTITKCD